MADEGDVLTNLDNNNGSGGGNGADNSPIAGLLSQYVKDLSVENPNAPACFQWPEQPDIDVQFNIGANQINDEIHEVELKIAVTARTQHGVSYAIELAYCGVIGMRNLPDEQSHAFLYAEAPRFLFPFARSVVADAVRDAGFPPLMLEPIDFQGLYLQQLQQRAEAGRNEGDEQGLPTGEA